MAVMPHSKQVVALLISTIGWLLCPFDLNKLSLAMANRFRNGFESGRETRNNNIEAAYVAHPTPGKDFELMKFFSVATSDLTKVRQWFSWRSTPGIRNYEWEYRWMDYPLRARDVSHRCDQSVSTLIRCYFSTEYR
ncbi:hypothetical protein Tco_0994567 [Tanacetum coccineum]